MMLVEFGKLTISNLYEVTMLFSLIYNIVCPPAFAVDGTEGISDQDLIGTWEYKMESGEVQFSPDTSRIDLLLDMKFACTDQFLNSGRLQSECTINNAILTKLDADTWIESVVKVKVNFNSTWYISGETLYTTITSANVQIGDQTVFVNNEDHSRTEAGNQLMRSFQKNLEQIFTVGTTSSRQIMYMSYRKFIYLDEDSLDEATVAIRK